MWEDERNKRGGRWLITLNKQQRRFDLDRFWLETVGGWAGEWAKQLHTEPENKHISTNTH